MNLAVHLLSEAWMGRFDVVAVVSSDTDLVEPLRMVSEELGKTVIDVCPDHWSTAPRLRSVATGVRHIRKRRLRDSQLPSRIPGTSIMRPDGWWTWKHQCGRTGVCLETGAASVATTQRRGSKRADGVLTADSPAHPRVGGLPQRSARMPRSAARARAGTTSDPYVPAPIAPWLEPVPSRVPGQSRIRLQLTPYGSPEMPRDALPVSLWQVQSRGSALAVRYECIDFARPLTESRRRWASRV